MKKLIQTQIEGRNPNLSLILGVKEELNEYPDLQNKTAVDILHTIRAEVSNVQQMITSQYAENVGNQCVTQ